ncbi:MAG: FkbM family methyltransferase, partial [Thermoleophilaceae bacterium]
MSDARRRAVSVAERVLPSAVMRRARVIKFDRERSRFPARVVEHEYAGVRHRVLIASPYAERYDRDWPEPQELTWLKRRRLRAGARVFDLGASAGVIAMMLADAVGPEGQVVALEAHPDDAAAIARNRDLNGLDQLVPVHAAVARESGEVVFGRNGFVDDGSTRWGDMRVPSLSVDDLARHYGAPDVVFIDVEGYEHEALVGARATLEQGPDWFVEVHGDEQLGVYGASSADVIHCLSDAGYELFAAPESRYLRRPDGTIVPEHPVRPLDD